MFNLYRLNFIQYHYNIVILYYKMFKYYKILKIEKYFKILLFETLFFSYFYNILFYEYV